MGLLRVLCVFVAAGDLGVLLRDSAACDLAVVDHIGGRGWRYGGSAADQVGGHARIEDARIEQRHAAHGLRVRPRPFVDSGPPPAIRGYSL